MLFQATAAIRFVTMSSSNKFSQWLNISYCPYYAFSIILPFMQCVIAVCDINILQICEADIAQ